MRQHLQQVLDMIPRPLPVISTGVCGFLVLAYLASLFNPALLENWALSATTLAEFQMHRLNTYPLIHTSLLHLLSNLLVLYVPLASFEVTHGSLHTAVLLNTLGAITGIAYTITTHILVYLGIDTPDVLDTYILGSSGWAFSFVTIHALTTSIRTPMTKFAIASSPYSIPTVFIPIIYLIISWVIVPNSSFLGHFISIICGFLVFKNLIAVLAIPPFRIFQRIESLKIFKWGVGILFPSEYFVWTWESEVASSRYQVTDFNAGPDASAGLVLPTHHAASPAPTPVPSFQGGGDKLGSSAQ